MIVNFAPKTMVEELEQNIACIIETVLGSAPLYRSFGLDWSDVDAPVNILQSRMTNRIISAIQDFEPRVTVDSVTYTFGDNGSLKPKVNFSIAGDAQ